MVRTRTGTSGLARLLALLVCAGCVVLIAHLARQSMAPTSTGDYAATARAAIERDKAAGRLTAEQAIIQRQQIAAKCR